jgi:hypothetical protein
LKLLFNTFLASANEADYSGKADTGDNDDQALRDCDFWNVPSSDFVNIHCVKSVEKKFKSDKGQYG